MTPRMIKTRIAQLNPIVGALEGNRDRAAATMAQAERDGLDLLVFPEMFIPGYPAQDLMLEPHFIDANLRCVESLAQQAGETITLIGAIHREDGDVYNGVAILQGGEIQDWVHKSLLPTYDVFDEWRYFKPARDNQPRRLRFRNGMDARLGIHVCEDLWDETMDYKVCDLMAEAGVDLFVNLSASPFQGSKFEERSRLVINKVKQFHKPYIYVNQVGGQDQLVFDGQSLVMDGFGNWMYVGPQFREEIQDLVVPLDSPVEHAVTVPETPLVQELYEALVLGIHDYFRKTGHTDAVLGLSGGIDSALTAALAADALGADHVLGVSMPSRYSSEHSVSDAEILARNLGIGLVKVPIESVYQAFQTNYASHLGGAVTGIAEENLQARIRGNILMTFSNRDGSLLLTTGNKTEIALGYCTLYGDMSGGLAVISDLGKRMVYDLSRYINDHKGWEIIPASTLEKPPSAELRENQVDPFDYEVVSPLVNAIVEEHASRQSLIERGYDPVLVDDMLYKIQINEYKRQQMPPGIRVTRKAFGIGRRMPIVNHYRQT